MKPEEVLTTMRDVLDTNNYFKDIFRWIGWKLIEALKWLVDGIEGAVNTMYDALSFSATDIMNKYTLTQTLFFVVMVVSIMVLGYKLMFKRESSKSNSFTGTLLVLVMCMGLPLIFSEGLSMFNRGAGVGELNKNKLSDTTIKSNITDLTINIKKEDFGFENGAYKPLPIEIPLENIKYIDSAESLNKDALDDLAENGGVHAKTNVEPFRKELHYNSKGEAVAKNFNTSKIIMGKDGYYRYQINWFSIMATLLIVGLTLILMAIKTAKTLFQLVLDKIVGTILMLTDLQEGKRAKELLTHVITTFTILLVSLVSINIYIELIGMLSTKLSINGSGGITNTFAFLLALAGASLALLEGSQVVEKLMGTRVDSGLTRTGAGLYGVEKMGQTVGNGVKGLGKTAMGVGGAVVGKPAKHAADKTGLTDKVNSGLDKGREMVGGVQNKVDKGLEKVGEKVGLRESSNDSSERNPMDTKTDPNTPKNAGFKNQEPINTGKGQGDSIDTGFKAQEPINTGTNQGSPIDTGFSSKETKNNTGASGNQGNSTNTGFSTNQGDLGDLSNSDSSSSYDSG
ncbi:MAG: pLS20_p028 family conjugation system transmembrane protein, partial [Clostridium sp.]